MTDPEQRGQAEVKLIERTILRVGVPKEEPEDNRRQPERTNIQNPSHAGPRTQAEGSGNARALPVGVALLS